MIDEKKLIAEIEKLKERAHRDYPYMEMQDGAECAFDDVLGIIEDMPKVGEWIPCSERLPEDLEAVAVTWINREPMRYYKDIKDKPFVDTAMRFKNKWYWWSVELEDYLLEYGRWAPCLIDEAVEITAWQPLPEPLPEPLEGETMNRLNIGRLCAECICAKCGYLKDCGVMEGNTNWYCHNECMGEAGAMNRCSQFEPTTSASETEPWEGEGDDAK